MKNHEIRAKLYQVLNSLAISKEQKEALSDIYISLIEAVTNGNTESNSITYDTATTSKLGLVKQAVTVTALEAEDDITTVISRVNTLISNLKTAGVVANN